MTTYPNQHGHTSAAPQAAGNYCVFYAALLGHLRGKVPNPVVTPAQIWSDMALLTAGQASAEQGVAVALPPLSAEFA